ncbi:MAG: hypothetical protein WD708_02050 [Kiritimatiellia bacterium]
MRKNKPKPKTPITLPALDVRFAAASAQTTANELIISTGTVARTWRWSDKGLVTVGLKDQGTGREWCEADTAEHCDWTNPDVRGLEGNAELLSLTARESDDEGFTTRHLEVVAEIGHPEAGLVVRYIIWAYPGAPGLRTQLWVKSDTAGVGAAGADEMRPAVKPVRATPGEGANAELIGSHYELKFKLENLDPRRGYMAGIHWIDADGAGRVQSVELTNTDGEAGIEAVPDTSLPVTEEAMRTAPWQFDIPVDLRPDGVCMLVIKPSPETSGAYVKDICLFEEGDRKTGEDDRDTPPVQTVPAGFSLVASLNAGTLRRQLEAQSGQRVERRVDFVPVSTTGRQRFAAGYYNDTQNRNKPETPVLRLEFVTEPVIEWASVLCLEDTEGGLAMVKESHKCVNQTGVDTGCFRCDSGGLSNTGWGLSTEEIGSDRFRWCWASWVIIYDNSPNARELAVKTFDRARFPVRADRDLWSVVCTWGHGTTPREGRNAAMETEVLTEMEHVANLGMDMLLIDDGWQVSPEAASWQPDGDRGWKPHPATYPDGWRRVIERKDELGLRLGLWGVAQDTGSADLLWNWRRLGMEQVKLDFADMKNQSELDAVMTKVRRFMIESGHRCIISWDTTENAARYGYFWAREYGNVHFMNRKPQKPERVIYVPWLALRDFWQLAHFQNLNKWQLTIQNPEVVNREHSDAWRHSAVYCVATALMGIPEFMAIPRHYSDQAGAEIRELLEIHKKHRRAIFDGYVFPIGEEPTNASWTGFQSWDASSKSGFLTVFRERLNPEPEKTLALRFVDPGTTVSLTDLRGGTKHTVRADEHGGVGFSLPVAPDFAFLHYHLNSSRL